MFRRFLAILALASILVGGMNIDVVRAAGTCSLRGLDTVAGLGTQISVSACTPHMKARITIENPSGTTYTQDIALDASGNATTLIPSQATTIAGVYRVQLGVGIEGTFSVIADRPDDVRSTIDPRESVADDGKRVITLTLKDRYDNPIAGRPIALMSHRTADEITGNGTVTNTAGMLSWTVESTVPGTAILTPFDVIGARSLKLQAAITFDGDQHSSFLGSLIGNEVGGSGEVTTEMKKTTAVTTLVDRFEITLPQDITEVNANELFSVTVRALRGTTLVRSYIGSLIVESTDPDAELPKKGEDPKSPETGRIDIRNVDQGERKVPLSFALRKRGLQTITVYDKLDPTMRGEITLNVKRGEGGSEEIVILDPKDRARVKRAPTILLQGKAPSLVNLKVKGGTMDVDGESDSEGVFRIEVPVHPEDKEVTFFVTSENGTYESSPVHIIIDDDAPMISGATITPEEGKAGMMGTLTVRAEPGVSVDVKTEQGSMPLTESGAGIYVGMVKAADTPGQMPLFITAKDSVGNEGTLQVQWKIVAKTVPTVQGVTANVKGKVVTLSWKPLIDVKVREYKVYIAKENDPTNYLFSVGTTTATTTATMKDLEVGVPYLFSLTAITDKNEESAEKSAPASATPLGLNLRATPAKDSILLEWSKLPDLPLNSYTLEFGTEPGVYTEKRTINGDAVTTVLRDLISGITYECKLTPIAVTGKALTDIASVVQATVGGSGFTPTDADPIPEDLRNPPLHSAPDDAIYEDVPSIASSGLSSIAFIMIGGIALLLSYMWLQHRREARMMEEFMASMRNVGQ